MRQATKLLFFAAASAATSAAAARAYSYRGALASSAGGNTVTASIDLGNSSSDRLIIVGTTVDTNTTVATVSAAGIALTPDISAANSFRVAIYSGLVTSGDGTQSVIVTFGSASFQEKNVFVWSATGLTSLLVKQATSYTTTTATISVTAGDLMFAVGRNNTGFTDFNSSTQTPSGTRQVGADNTSADWTVTATSAAFVLGGSTLPNQAVAATYA